MPPPVNVTPPVTLPPGPVIPVIPPELGVYCGTLIVVPEIVAGPEVPVVVI